jgi:hypothetical protein
MPTNVFSSVSTDTPLRLFMLRYGKRGVPVRNSNGQAIYFTTKEEAKRSRDELNTGLTPPIFVVSIGPDHKPVKYKRK